VGRALGAGIVALGLAGSACTNHVPPPARAPTTVTVPEGQPGVARDTPRESERPHDNPCFARGRPKPIVLRAPGVPEGCARADITLARGLTAELRKLYRPFAVGARLDVAFECGSSGRVADRIVLEHGEGHGFSLELWELVRRSDHFDVRGVLYAPSRWGKTSADSARGYRVAQGELSLASVEAALPRARALLASRLVEVAPKLPPGTIGGFSFGMSSRNFYQRLELFAPDGGNAGVYTGYESSGVESRLHLPLELAAEPLEKLVEALPRDDREAEPEQRRLFAESFVRAAPRFADDFWWWVGERYVELAAELGSPDLVPHLLELVAKLKPDNRLMQAALLSIEAISGFRVSLDPHGSLLSPAASRERVLAECGGASAPRRGSRSA
jgi:hypothetical protein